MSVLQFPQQPAAPESEPTGPTPVTPPAPGPEQGTATKPPELSPEQQQDNYRATMRSINETEVIACIKILAALNGNTEDVKNATDGTELDHLKRKFLGRAILLKRGIITMHNADTMRKIMAASTPPMPQPETSDGKEGKGAV